MRGYSLQSLILQNISRSTLTAVCSMSRSMVTSPWELEILPFSTAIFSAIYSGSWQLTVDS